MDDMIEALAETLEWATSCVALVQPEHLDRPTPCAGWIVRHLINHMVGGNVMYAMAAEGMAPDVPLIMGDLIGDDAQGAYVSTAHRAASAWRAVDLTQTLTLPYGRVAASFSIRTHQMDHLLHGWDLCASLGIERQAPLHLVSYTDAVLDALPSEVIDNPRVFSTPREAPVGASAFDRLAARSGRTTPP
ncbi:MAG: TIGR03086 family metal-binding protein [Acidimicrobiia bacterium]